LRLAAMVLAPFKLRCCDINSSRAERSRHIKPRPEFFKWITSARSRRDRGRTVDELTRIIFSAPRLDDVLGAL
jgi:hypothetical protein